MNRRSRYLQPLLDPQWAPWLFLAAAVLLGIVSNAVYDLMVEALGTVVAAAVAGSLGLAALILGYRIYLLLGRREPAGGLVAPRRCLIALVSQGDLERIPAYASVLYHLGGESAEGPLARCYLIAGQREADSEQEPLTSSWSNACRLEQLLVEKGRACEIIEVVADDCQACMRGCNEAWRRA